MARAATIPTPFSLRQEFTELPIFHQFTAGTVWRTGRIDGSFEVSFDASGDWVISDIWIETDNGRIGPEAKGLCINIDPDTHEGFYLLAIDAIEAQYKSLIEELIGEELAERNIRVAA
jgi:hypothetical protein